MFTPKSKPIPYFRLISFYIIIGLTVLAFSARLYQLQVVKYDYYAEQAQENRTFTVNLAAPRGVIYDRNGVELARNVAQFNVTITPAFLPENDVQIALIYQAISKLTGVPVKTPPLDAGEALGNKIGVNSPPPGIQELVALQDSNAPYDSVVVAPDISRETALLLSEKLRTMPGVNIEVLAVRDYPTGELTAHIIGYMGPIPESQTTQYRDLGFNVSRDKIGYDGIEYQFQNLLAGQNGKKVVEQDVAGFELRPLGEVQEPIVGENIYLTIDIRLQAAAAAALKKTIQQENINRVTKGEILVTNGVVIAMQPQTGEILAMYSYPSYDNDQFARFIPVDYYQQLAEHPNLPLLNQAISGEHPPGSVFKIPTAAYALEFLPKLKPNLHFSAYTEIFDPGRILITNRYFPNDPGKSREVVCWNRTGHGKVDFYTGIAQSCDVYFYSISGGYPDGGLPDGIGIDGIYAAASSLGYNKVTGVELPGERSGLLPTKDWKRLNFGENWSTGDTYITSMGQGFVLATPLQVLNAYTPFMPGNNGQLIQPTLIHHRTNGNGEFTESFSTRYKSKTPFGQYVIDQINIALRKVMIDGTGKDLNPLAGIEFAGKSGTAEYCDNIAQAQSRCRFGAWPAHAWFVTYAPWDNPEIEVLAFLYAGMEGSTLAGPVAVEVANTYFELKAIDAQNGIAR